MCKYPVALQRLEDDFEHKVFTDIEECNPVLFYYTSVDFVVGEWENRGNLDSNRTYIRTTYRSLELNTALTLGLHTEV